MPDDKKETPKSTTSLGLPKNTASALSYGLGWITGLIFLLFEKDKQVRFHALQSIAVFGSLNVLQIVLRNTYVFDKLGSLVGVGAFILWLALIFKTYTGEKWVLPYAGKWAENQVKKMK